MYALNSAVFVICACTILSEMTSCLLICILLEPKNNESNLEIIYSQLAGRCEIFNFHRKTGGTQCWGGFFCLPMVNFKGLACRHSVKHKSDNKLSIVIQWRTFLKWSISNFFLYERHYLRETNYYKFLISNFLSHSVSTDMPGDNLKSNIWIFIMHTKK